MRAMHRMLFWHLAAAQWRAQPLRMAVALLSIALGVALGFAIHLVNDAALGAFTHATRTLAGDADLTLRSSSGDFPEAWDERIATLPGVAASSAVLEFRTVPAGGGAPLAIVGIDIFRAAAITPAWLGEPDGEARDDRLAHLSADSVFLSAAARENLRVATGDTLQLLGGENGREPVTLRVAGGLPGAPAGQRLAAMDLGTAQWRFGRLGKISRIDIRLEAGTSAAALQKAFSTLDPPPGLMLTAPEQGVQRAATMSRAYRVNLGVLALVALLTGGFLVFSTQMLATVRRRAEFGLLRTLGLTRKQLLRQLLAEGALLGVLGAVPGLALGAAAAAGLLAAFGGDLGSGQFSGAATQLSFDFIAAAGYAALGIAAALAGTWLPARAAALAEPAAAMKPAAGGDFGTRAPGLMLPLLLWVAGALLAALPPLGNVPLAGYLAIACLLLGGVTLTPWLALRLAQRVPDLQASHAIAPLLTLARLRLVAAPGEPGVALAGVVASLGLVVAMAVMVGSFRLSVTHWLDAMLPADLYMRLGSTAIPLRGDDLHALRAVPGVERVEGSRHRTLQLQAERPPVALIARQLDMQEPEHMLALLAPNLALPDEFRQGDQAAVPVWISEAMRDLYGMMPGTIVELPLSGLSPVAQAPAGMSRSGGGARVFIAGIRRDYANQHGSIVMQLDDWQRLSGDLEFSDVHVWLLPAARQAGSEGVIAALREALPKAVAAHAEFATSGEIRALSLRIFDRSFAVTHALEAAAILIGLFGIAGTLAAQALARAREFGMLRHIGVTRRQLLGLLLAEGALTTLTGIAGGLLTGLAISAVLVFVVNPQSFNWTMDWHVPAGTLALLGAGFLASALLTVALAGRRALSADAVRAVRDDW